MGREVKRVPLDFDWPLDNVWEGYLNPYWKYRRECPFCKGTGLGEETRKLSEQWYGWETPFSPEMTGSVPFSPDDEQITEMIKTKIARSPEYDWGGWRYEARRMCEMWNSAWSHHLDKDDVLVLAKSGRLSDFTGMVYFHEETQKWVSWGKDKTEVPAPAIPEPSEVNRWSLFGFGHDSINQWQCVKAKAERLGYVVECGFCEGDGGLWENPEYEIEYEKWERLEPPTGEGWQVWETVSEGSPVTPVFSTPDALVSYLVDHNGYSQPAAEKFVKETQWVMSGVMVGEKYYKDIESSVV